MSYKFMMGEVTLSGSLTQTSGTLVAKSKGEISASSKLQGGAGTLASLALNSGGITAAGAIAGATTIDASGDLTVGTITMSEFTVAANGNTDIDGTLNVEGVPTFQAAAVFSSGISAAGSIAGATTIDASGDLTVGTITMSEFTVAANGNTDIDGTLNVEGVPTFQAAAVFSSGITTANAIAGATTISGSGKLTVDNLAVNNSYTWLASGALSAGAGSFKGNLSSSNKLDVDQNVTFGADLTMNKSDPIIQLGWTTDSALDVSTDSLYFLDDTNKGLKVVDIDSFCTDIAGAGLSEKNGQLVVDGQGTANSASFGSILKEGYNYCGKVYGTAKSFGLPTSPTDGDVVHLKSVDIANGLSITVSSSTKIDGQSSVAFSSDHVALSFLYASGAEVGKFWAIV